MSNPELALCIPAYNAADYLSNLFQSAENQTEPFDEILVYDDCSTDNTSEVARNHGAEVISGAVNKGPSVARARLAEAANADWLHFHDSDDVLYPNFVAESKKWMSEESPPDVVFFSYEYRHYDSGDLISVREFNAEALRQDPIGYNIQEQINPFCGLYRRESFLEAGGPDTDPKVLYNEDPAMHCKLARAGLTFDADPTVTLINYKREGSLSRSNRVKCRRSRYYVLEKCAEHNGDTHGVAIARELWKEAGLLAAHLQWDLADKAARLAVELGGRFPKYGGGLFRIFGSVSPHMALRVREWAIRLFKPQFREHDRYGVIKWTPNSS
jgi:glycosyltransferase involved in cell wall biosynthesis